MRLRRMGRIKWNDSIKINSYTGLCLQLHLWRIIYEHVRWWQICVAQNDKFPHVICTRCSLETIDVRNSRCSWIRRTGYRLNRNNVKLIYILSFTMATVNVCKIWLNWFKLTLWPYICWYFALECLSLMALYVPHKNFYQVWSSRVFLIGRYELTAHLMSLHHAGDAALWS